MIKKILVLISILSACTPFYRYKLQDAKRNAKALDLSSSNYTVPPDDIFKFRRLEDINLSNNPNLEWTATLEKLNRIDKLSALFLNEIPSINLKQVSTHLSKNRKLRYLSLSKNGIQTLPDEISLLISLESINLSDNLKLDIVNTIMQLSKLPNLKYVYLNNCNLDQVPASILEIKKLEFLNLAGNRLDTLPNLSVLDNFNSLDISSNHFKRIPNDLTKIRRRINFYAGNNQITYISDAILYMKFQTFNLTNNPLTPATREKIRRLVNARYKWY